MRYPRRVNVFCINKLCVCVFKLLFSWICNTQGAMPIPLMNWEIKIFEYSSHLIAQTVIINE